MFGRAAALVAILLISACFYGGDAETISGNATGGSAADVTVNKYPGGRSYELRAGDYRNLPPPPSPAYACYTNFGACPMAVPVPVESSCFCPSPYGGAVNGIAR